jgi:hypothetical protein
MLAQNVQMCKSGDGDLGAEAEDCVFRGDVVKSPGKQDDNCR